MVDVQDQYLQTWTEPDPELRRASIDRRWAAADGRLVVSSLGIAILASAIHGN
ncbi:hypothetical protein GCM10023321_46980 [Pseudonocardia eucalypti]|uniref:Uncharacterized protein n=1 Tax=Pseudonocardia eucalypti TaxID=648755 RepID=A0ABP9QHJ9_9PSEU|nr:hypothetical protein [Pseudonocardia eucalypti]